MRFVRNCLLFLLLATAVSTACAQETKSLSVFPPDGFQFTGTWDCTGSFRNAQLHKATFSGAVILGGKWLELTEKDVEPATGYVAKYLIGYDPQQKHLVEFDANNFGAATYASEDGWHNSVLTMTSPVSQDAKVPYVANRFLYSVIDPNTFSVDWQISRTAVLDWKTADHLACKLKAASS